MVSGVAARCPVEVRADHEHGGGGRPAPGRPLLDAEQREEAAEDERDAPGEVLVVDEGGRRQEEDDRAAHHAGHQHAVRGRLGPADEPRCHG